MIIGERKSSVPMGRGYQQDAICEYASAFGRMAQNLLQQETVNIFSKPVEAVTIKSCNESLKQFFVENSYDPKQFENDAAGLEDYLTEMEALYENDREAVLEYSSVSSFNPVVGLTFPIHKNILMNASFEKAFQKVVATSPKFTLSMETRILTTPEGVEIDMFKEQNAMTKAIDSTVPFVEVAVKLPEMETVDILTDTFHGNKGLDNLSIQSYISAVLVETYVENGAKVIDPATLVETTATAAGMAYVWAPIKKEFTLGYGDYDRQMMEKVVITVKTSATVTATVTTMLSGYMKGNMFMLQSANPLILAAKIKAKMDSSTAMIQTCSTSWKTKTTVVEIPEATPFNTPVSPEEVKDVSALYQTNQLTKIMSMIKDVMVNYKDDKIHTYLDDSFTSMANESKIAECFDFAPREGYFSDHVSWRRDTFMDSLDTYATELIQVLNDPNMTITVIGRPDLIRKITPTTYVYQTPSSIGPIQLDYTKTVTTSDKRVYQFISSDKLRGNNNLIVILNPRNTDRIIYRIYDYQMYVSNEIRNAGNYALPAIHAFERFKMVDYQPVQGRLKVLNPTGLRTRIANTDPIGESAYNDMEANLPG